jgi:imidazolonepropionase-like amidohydrolase
MPVPPTLSRARRSAALGASLLGALAGACRPGGAAVARDAPRSSVHAIVHVTVIDPTSGPRPDATVLIDGDRIVQVGPSATTAIPPGAAVHEASGEFAVPGLWDSHVHVSQMSVDSIPLLVASGVTGVRDMGSDLADIARWRAIRSRGGLAPRVFSPGPKLDGTGEPGNDSWVVATPSEGRAAVDRLQALGVDFIKVHNGLTRAVYDAIADECRVRKLPFAGHATGEFPPLVAVAAGQRTIEHGRGMIPCSPRVREQIRANPALAPLGRVCAPESTAEQMLPAMARAGVWFTPTLVSWRGQTLDRRAAAALDGVADVPPVLARRWHEGEASGPPVAIELEVLAQFGPLAARAARTGVHLLAGTDTGDPYVVPGFALHDELRLLVEAGLSPLVAIRSATLEPALALGVSATMGSIESGKVADLVILSADPLADIRNTRRIAAVVLHGRWLGAEQLGALLPSSRRRSSDDQLGAGAPELAAGRAVAGEGGAAQQR